MKNPLLRIQGLHALALLFTLFFSVQTYGVAPVLDNIEPGILNYTEGDGAVLITTTITVKDVDDTLLQSATITIANFRSGEDVLSFTGISGINYTWDNVNGVLYLFGSANIAAYQALLRTVTYENTSLAPTEVSRTVSFVVNDGVLKSNTVSRTIAVTSVNEAPLLTVISPASISYTENDPAVRINNTINLADGDDTHMESATVAITSNYQEGQDTLTLTNPSGITGVFNAETGVITFTGHATLALYVTALRSVHYQNTSDNPSTPTRQISFSVNDGDDKSNTLIFSITVTAVNDVPILRNMEATTLPFTENSPAVAVTATLSVSDPDNANLTTAKIEITGNYQSGEDTLLYSTLNGITGSWNKGTGTLSLSGSATLAQYTAALRSVKYQNISEDPSVLTRTVSFTANDGTGTSLAATRNIAVSAVNDAPVLSRIEVLPLAYTAGAGLKILTDSIQVADTDDVNLETATIRILGNYKTGQDFIRYSTIFGISGTWTAGTGTMTLNGPASVANFRSALRSVKYENTNTINPSTLARTITFRVNDGTANSNTLSRVVSFVPTATISGGDTICRYQKDSILIDLTGEPNWTVVIRRTGGTLPKDTTISGITTSHYGFLTNTTGSYVLLSVKDKNYDAGLVYGSAIILNYPLTTAKLTGAAQICQDGSSAPLTVDFTGTSPWTFGLRRNTQDTIYTGITQDPFIINVNKQGIYRITSLSDKHCIGDTVAGYGTTTLSYISSPKATISGTDSICQGDTATLNVLFEGTAPFSITYLVNGANAHTISNITQVDYALEVKAEGIYTLSAVSDHIRSGCVSGFGTVAFYPSPTAAISGSGPICEHTSANLRVILTGSAPWTFSYRRNTADTATVTGVAASPNFVSVIKAGTYSLVTVSDKLCKGTVSGSAVITVTPAPEVEITGLDPAYSKDKLMVPVFGNPEGGTFIPPLYLINDTNYFFPMYAGPGMHTIVYAYRDAGTSCYGYDTVTVMVLAADADILFPENDTKKLFCYNDSAFTIYGNNTVNDTGTFTISGGIGLVDNGDNSATIDPSRLNGGTYSVRYRYKNVTYLEISESFELENITGIYFIGFEDSTYCQSSVPIRLNGGPSGGVFDGNAVYGNTSSGFYFRSDLTGPGPDTVFYTLTGPKGCFRRINKSLIIYDTPHILFAVNDTCIYNGVYDSTAFVNLTACGDAIQSWYWNFDDIESGAKNSSTLKNPKHRYRDGGRRDVLLRATSSQGCLDEDYITFNFGDKPLAAFSWETECFHAGQKIAFTNESSFSEGEIKEYLWKFTNGVSDDTYTTKDVDYQFGSPDDYEVELFVSTSYGCTDTILKAIHVRPTYSLQKGSSYYESFESGTAGWASGHDDMVPLNSWTMGDPVNFGGDGGGGVKAWYTNITSNQPDAEQSYVTSPCFSFEEIFKPMIKFAMRRLFNANRDGAILQYSTDNWKTLMPLGKYEVNGLDGINWYNWVGIEGTPGGSVVGWSNVKDGGWIVARHSLDMLKGKKDVQFRLAYGSDGTAIGTEGMAFDNVWIGERNKMTLIEHFTSTSDEASLSADNQLDAMANASPLDIIDIQYHTSFAGIDPFNQQNQADPGTRASLYQVSTVPVSILNGFTTSKFRFDYADNELDTNFIKIQSLADPKFSLDLQSTRLDNSLDMTVTIKPLEALAKHRVTLHIAVIERMVWGVTGANGDTMFESVLKIMLPDTSFTNDWDPASGQTFIVERDWNFKNTYDAAELRVIAFLQDEDTREIYQSAISEYDLHTGIPGDNNPYINNESTGFIVFPNPASTDVYIMFEEALEKKARADLFDINGRLVMTRELFPGNTLYETALHNFPEGLYFLRITSDNQFVGLHKLIISR